MFSPEALKVPRHQSKGVFPTLSDTWIHVICLKMIVSVCSGRRLNRESFQKWSEVPTIWSSIHLTCYQKSANFLSCSLFQAISATVVTRIVKVSHCLHSWSYIRTSIIILTKIHSLNFVNSDVLSCIGSSDIIFQSFAFKIK